MAKKSVEAKAVAGPGKKACPECSTVVGVRTGVCPNCQHAFEKKDKAAPKTKAAPADDFKSRLITERDNLEGLLANRDQLEKRLQAINDLLDTM